MGNTSSFRVHFPASYVRLPECSSFKINHPKVQPTEIWKLPKRFPPLSRWSKPMKRRFLFFASVCPWDHQCFWDPGQEVRNKTAGKNHHVQKPFSAIHFPAPGESIWYLSPHSAIPAWIGAWVFPSCFAVFHFRVVLEALKSNWSSFCFSFQHNLQKALDLLGVRHPKDAFLRHFCLSLTPFFKIFQPQDQSRSHIMFSVPVPNLNIFQCRRYPHVLCQQPAAAWGCYQPWCPNAGSPVIALMAQMVWPPWMSDPSLSQTVTGGKKTTRC